MNSLSPSLAMICFWTLVFSSNILVILSEGYPLQHVKTCATREFTFESELPPCVCLRAVWRLRKNARSHALVSGLCDGWVRTRSIGDRPDGWWFKNSTVSLPTWGGALSIWIVMLLAQCIFLLMARKTLLIMNWRKRTESRVVSFSYTSPLSWFFDALFAVYGVAILQIPIFPSNPISGTGFAMAQRNMTFGTLDSLWTCSTGEGVLGGTLAGWDSCFTKNHFSSMSTQQSHKLRWSSFAKSSRFCFCAAVNDGFVRVWTSLQPWFLRCLHRVVSDTSSNADSICSYVNRYDLSWAQDSICCDMSCEIFFGLPGRGFEWRGTCRDCWAFFRQTRSIRAGYVRWTPYREHKSLMSPCWESFLWPIRAWYSNMSAAFCWGVRFVCLLVLVCGGWGLLRFICFRLPFIEFCVGLQSLGWGEVILTSKSTRKHSTPKADFWVSCKEWSILTPSLWAKLALFAIGK